MKKTLLIIVSLLSIIYFSYFFRQKFYSKKFEKTEDNSNIKSIIEEWGEPSEKFNYGDDEIVLFYKKDWLDLEKIAFVFSKKDSILIRKSIDD